MIIDFRILAVSKETGHYDTDLLRGVFGSNNPTLDVVDHLPITTTMNVISESGWIPISKEILKTPTHLLVAYVKENS